MGHIRKNIKKYKIVYKKYKPPLWWPTHLNFMAAPQPILNPTLCIGHKVTKVNKNKRKIMKISLKHHPTERAPSR